jgi:hypothetical protein
VASGVKGLLTGGGQGGAMRLILPALPPTLLLLACVAMAAIV